MLQSLSIKPAPVVIGQNSTFNASLYFNETDTTQMTTNGSLILTISAPNRFDCQMTIIQFIEYNLCEVASKCPIEPGTNFTSSLTLPDTAIPPNNPPGIYMINGEFTDQTGETLGCISSLIQFATNKTIYS